MPLRARSAAGSSSPGLPRIWLQVPLHDVAALRITPLHPQPSYGDWRPWHTQPMYDRHEEDEGWWAAPPQAQAARQAQREA